MKPKIAVVLSGYGLVSRGAETMLDQLLPRLEDNFELHVFSRSGAGPHGRRHAALPRTATEPLYRATRLGRKVFDTLFLDPIHLEWTSHLLLSSWSLLRGGFDVIWHETGFWGGHLLRLVRALTGARLLDVAHSNAEGWEIAFARCRPDAFVVFNDEFADMIRSAVAGLRVEVIPQGVDLNTFRPVEDPWSLEVEPPVVLVAGALSAEKDPFLALEAVAKTRASVVFAGAGSLAEGLDALAAERLPAERYQRLLLERSDMPRLYCAADLLLVTSPREAGPLVALEAMACGVPAVGAADAARRQTFGDAGILVDRQDPADYADAIEQSLQQDWQDYPRRQADRYSIESTTQQFNEVLTDLARRKP